MKIHGRWRRYKKAPVWERSDGLRVNIHGLVLVSPGQCAYQPSYDEIEHWKKIVGGKRHRALMAYANERHPLGKDH
jgi:hypothetical protein